MVGRVYRGKFIISMKRKELEVNRPEEDLE